VGSTLQLSTRIQENREYLLPRWQTQRPGCSLKSAISLVAIHTYYRRACLSVVAMGFQGLGTLLPPYLLLPYRDVGDAL